MTDLQILGLLFLGCFGVIYNLIVERLQRNGQGSFMAALVIIGVLITLFVLYIDSPGTFSNDVWIALTLGHFAASGCGVTLGSWQRR